MGSSREKEKIRWSKVSIAMMRDEHHTCSSIESHSPEAFRVTNVLFQSNCWEAAQY